MKKVFLLFVFGLLLSLSTVHASPYSGLFPGGTNYLEEDNLRFTRDSMGTIDPIRVHSGQNYTIWFPPTGLWEYPYIELYSGQDTLLEGYAHELDECSLQSSMTYCTFQTTDDTVEFIITSQGIGQYYEYYGMNDIQMEEGTTPTAYETYIPPVMDVNGPEFSGTATFVKSYEETIPISQIIEDHIYVYDEIDGDVTSSIVVTNDSYTANMHTVGQYSATLTAVDNSGNQTSMTLNVLVKDEISPVIEGPVIVSVAVDSVPDASTIIEELYVATDGYDGELPISIIADDYSLSTKDVGAYQIVLGAEDSSGNTTSKAILIDVKDTIAPELVSSPTITHYTSENIDVLDILNSLVVSDNFNLPEDITKTILVDNLSGQEQIPGDYALQVRLRDLSDNITIVDLLITIEDDVAPVISGPSTISLSYMNAPTLTELLEELTITDDVSTLLVEDFVVVTDEYTTRPTKTGTFDITVLIADLAGNQTEHTISVTLIDDQGPTIYVDNFMITVTSQASFAPQDALNMMISNNELEPGEYEIITLSDEYTDNRFTPGMYAYELQFINQKGETFDKEFMIHVTDIEEPVVTSWTTTLRHILVYSSTITITGIVLYRMKK
jgi:hypothetical protein